MKLENSDNQPAIFHIHWVHLMVVHYV